MEGTDLFRDAEQWLSDNPGKNLSHYRKETGYTGPALKTRHRKGEPIRVSYKGKSTASQVKREQLSKPKTEGEAQHLRKTKSQARARSQSTLHQHTYKGRPSIAEHDVRIADGGTNEHMSISDPEFKNFKDNIESKLPKGYVADIDDVSGGVRVIPEKVHNKYQPTSKQPGATFELGENNLIAMKRLQRIAKTFGLPAANLRASLGGYAGYITEIDEITGGHVNKSINTLVAKAKNEIQYIRTHGFNSYK